MRIKKKELLEALDINKTKADKENGLKIATDLAQDGAEAKQEIIKTLGNGSETIANELVGAALKNEEKEEEVKSKKRVKEVVKVKNLKK